MDYRNLTISTKRLSLEAITFEYVDMIFKHFTTDITEFMYPQPSGNKKDTINFIEWSLSKMKEGTNIQQVIIHSHTREFLGAVGLHNVGSKSPELGIWVKKDAHGCRYGYEAIEALITYAKQHLEFDYLKYPVDKENIPSRKIPERYGAKIESEYAMTNPIGKELHIIEYRIYK